LKKTFDLTLSTNVHAIVAPFVNPTPKAGGSAREYSLDVHPDNLAGWTKLFLYLWDEICLILLEKNSRGGWKVRKQPPESIDLQVVVTQIQALYHLRKIVEHLFSLPAVQISIRQEGLS
jgi:hypothetical protein